MDFKRITEILLAAFKEQNIRYALMGGFAMGLLGRGRSTVDLDFLVNREDIGKVDGIMRKLGYECRYESENVSQYISPLMVFGEVDFIYAFREPSLQMLERAEEKEVFGSMKIKVLQPEDLVGMKLQAMKNDPSRKHLEVEDIKFLFILYRDTMNWKLIEHYVDVLGMEELYKELHEEK